MSSEGGSIMVQTCCKLICIGGALALFGVYAFANPDLKTPAGATGAVHCFINGAANLSNFSNGAGSAGEVLNEFGNLIDPNNWTAQCIPCPHPYTADECVGTDVTEKWLMLMTLGFVAHALPIITVFLTCIAMSANSKGLMGCSVLLTCVFGCCNLAWYIASCVMRFSAEGAAISGTNWAAQIGNMNMEQINNNFNNDICDAEGSPLMCSTGLLIIVLDIMWFVGMGLGCLCCIIGMICCRAAMSKHMETMKEMNSMK